MLYEDQNFPVYDYTFTVEQLLFDQGTMLIRYLPVDETLSAIVLNIPIWPSMDLNDLKTYTGHFAPNDKWYAQKMILNHSSQLTGNQ
jgi:hypothetical protein